MVDILVSNTYFSFDGYPEFEGLISGCADVRVNWGNIAIGDLLVKLGGDALFAFQFDRGGPRFVFGSPPMSASARLETSTTPSSLTSACSASST